MRLGIVCEGRTDYPAIEHYFGYLLDSAGRSAEFRPLYPHMDETRPGGGWANVLLWFEERTVQARIQQYFGGGLFGGGLSTPPLDAIVVHLDADVIEDSSFRNFVGQRYGIEINSCDDASDRAAQIARVLEAAMDRNAMTDADNRKHVEAIAVESTETWCVAAFYAQPQDWEAVRGQRHRDLFMSALERFEGRGPNAPYANVSKDYRRRLRFCEGTRESATRVRGTCSHFAEAVQCLLDLA